MRSSFSIRRPLVPALALGGQMVLVVSLTGCLPEPPTDRAIDILVTGLSSEETALAIQIAHTSHIEQGLMANERCRNVEVHALAGHEVEEHTKAAEQLATLMRQLGPAPRWSPLLQQIQDESDGDEIRLDQCSRKEFDRAYLDAAMLSHSRMLGLIDNILAGGRTRGEEGSDYHLYLQRIRTMINRHFITAESLRDSGIVR
jgi:putative membrane protein